MQRSTMLVLVGCILVMMAGVMGQKLRISEEKKVERPRRVPSGARKTHQEKLEAIQEQVQARVKKYGKQHKAQETAKREAKRRRRLKLMDADLSGVWATGNGWAYLYPNGRVTLFSDSCALKQKATWKYEYGSFDNIPEAPE